MSRSSLFDKLRRSMRLGLHAERTGAPTAEVLERAADASARRPSRRDFLAATGTAAAAGLAVSALGGGAGCAFGPPDERDELGSGASPLASTARIGIVGAGLAGLACATDLAAAGVRADLFEATTRVGGRQSSLGGAFAGPVTFPGQVVERGGELIDNAHKAMLGYANKLGLALENYHRNEGEVFYHIGGAAYPEAAVVDEFRALVARMRADLRRVGEPTALDHTDDDVALDNVSLAEYLATRGAGPVIAGAIESAYVGEYGLEIDRQSCLSFLLFIHSDRRSKWTPFGIFSDERYHVVGGNQLIAEGLRARLPAAPRFGHALVRVARTSSGRVALTFRTAGGTRVETVDAVVLTMPFSTLRDVELAPSLGLPDWKLRAIDELQYGTNAKMMVGFDGRAAWTGAGSSGAAYSLGLANHQVSWETGWTTATSSHAVLTDYSGGERGARLRPDRAQEECDLWLRDLDRIYPGARAAATRDAAGRYLVHLEHWPSNPWSKGSYTANHVGYFTTIADLEAPPVDNVYFAGEHTSSFYEWQGFMEGACLSGQRAAAEILAAMKKA